MKLLCEYGHMIVDQTDNLPYKGFIIRDQHWEPEFDRVVRKITFFMHAVAEGKGHQWVSENIGEGYASFNLDDMSLIEDSITVFMERNGVNIYQCEKCSRLLVQHPRDREYHTFAPDKSDSGDILAVKRENSNELR